MTLGFLLSLILIFPFTAFSKSHSKTPDLVAKDLGGIVWSIEFISPKEILFSLKSGRIKVLDLNTKKITEIKSPPPSSDWGQGGLLDLHLHPDFTKNKIIYLAYTKKLEKGYSTAIAMARLENEALTDLKEIFVSNDPNNNKQHFGSRIVHDDQGYLFFTVGDRGERDLAQRLDSDAGKIHRLKLDGSTPEDNPFVKTKNARKTIWSYGHRNPQGLVFDFKNKILWEQEHGPRGGDEINRIVKGKNYGWPIVTYGKEYWGPKIGTTKKEGMEQPLFHYTPSIAPSGLEIWNGDLFSGALKLTHLNRLDLDSKSRKAIKEERWFEDLGERIRDVKLDPQSQLYFSTDSGKIFKVSSSSKN